MLLTNGHAILNLPLTEQLEKVPSPRAKYQGNTLFYGGSGEEGITGP